MRVYDHGLLWTELKTKCPKCHCDFIYQPKDIQSHIDYDFDTKSGVAYKYIFCPECGHECIYTDPTINRTYNDDLSGVPNGEDDSPDIYLHGIIYDGGDDDQEEHIYDEDGNEEL